MSTTKTKEQLIKENKVLRQLDKVNDRRAERLQSYIQDQRDQITILSAFIIIEFVIILVLGFNQ